MFTWSEWNGITVLSCQAKPDQNTNHAYFSKLQRAIFNVNWLKTVKLDDLRNLRPKFKVFHRGTCTGVNRKLSFPLHDRIPHTDRSEYRSTGFSVSHWQWQRNRGETSFPSTHVCTAEFLCSGSDDGYTDDAASTKFKDPFNQPNSSKIHHLPIDTTLSST